MYWKHFAIVVPRPWCQLLLSPTVTGSLHCYESLWSPLLQSIVAASITVAVSATTARLYITAATDYHCRCRNNFWYHYYSHQWCNNVGPATVVITISNCDRGSNSGGCTSKKQFNSIIVFFILMVSPLIMVTIRDFFWFSWRRNFPPLRRLEHAAGTNGKESK